MAELGSTNKQHHLKSKDSRQLVIINSYRPKSGRGDASNFQQGVDMLQIAAPLPEQVALSTGNSFDTTFDIFQFKQTLVNWFSKAKGKKYSRGIAERQYWDGIENQEITLELEFTAFHSGYWDVVVPCRNLMLLALPTESGTTTVTTNDVEGMENAWASWDEPPTVSVSIGNFLNLVNVGISNCSISFSNKLDDNFMPLSATASVSFIMTDPFGTNTLVSEMMPWNNVSKMGGPDG